MLIQLKSLKFSRKNLDFAAELNRRVNEYFSANNIGKQGNMEMFIKTACMFSLYFVPYFMILTGVVTSMLPLTLLVVVMSAGLAGIGLSVMHDANHGAYSRFSFVNNLVGYSLNLVGANSFNWKIQHNVLHHTFTNIHEHDEDILSRGILRLEPHSKWKPVYRYQHIYAWFLYGLMTISWIFFKDISRLIKYQRNGMAKKQKANLKREWIIMVITKCVYAGYIFVLPLLFTPLVWWQILLGVLLMHYLAGFFLSVVFQPAHVIEGTEFPLPDNDANLENTWAVHQLLTTTNFGNRSRWFSWFVGGLNFQIEHHLLPNICHVHYRKISPIVKATAADFGFPYKNSLSFLGALKGHARLLKNLGMKPLLSA